MSRQNINNYHKIMDELIFLDIAKKKTLSSRTRHLESGLFPSPSLLQNIR
jgi:hypothetical protein